MPRPLKGFFEMENQKKAYEFLTSVLGLIEFYLKEL